MEYLAIGASILGFIFLWVHFDWLLFRERMDRRRDDLEQMRLIKTIGDDLNLLTLRHKKLAANQSRSVHLHLHDETIKPKGAGASALISKSKH